MNKFFQKILTPGSKLSSFKGKEKKYLQDDQLGSDNSNNEDQSSGGNEIKIKGTVVLMNNFDVNDVKASVLDKLHEFFLGKGFPMQLISFVPLHHSSGNYGWQEKVVKTANLEKDINPSSTTTAEESAFSITFKWDESMRFPYILKLMKTNNHQSDFYLKTVTLEDVPGHGRLCFVCNSWICSEQGDRLFFSNKSYLPQHTPEPLCKYRQQELENLREKRAVDELKGWDRVYDYDYYNDLGDTDKGKEYTRPVLGGSLQYPYPRRGRTGRKPTNTDANSESRLPYLSQDIYVPRDEQRGPLSYTDSISIALKSLVQVVLPELTALRDKAINQFNSFEDVLDIFRGTIRLPNAPSRSKTKEDSSFTLEPLKEIFAPTSSAQGLLKFPMPAVVEGDLKAWMNDEEFGRQILAGPNPVVIRRLNNFPPTSKLNPEVYGQQNSSITHVHLQKYLGGCSVEHAIERNKLFILEYHDILMPYLRRINSTTTKTYASRTILFMQDDGALKPVVIELSLPDPDGESDSAVSKVFTPAEDGAAGSEWLLAKAYAAVNDSGHHQLISHWLNTHAVIEPFVIATNRQLSVLHPVYKLLQPHFRSTMNINALARQVLINADGVFEKTLFPTKYGMEISSVAYKDWVFTEQALPVDLIKRGMAVLDPSSSPDNPKLVIKDYPYAVDGLEIWSAIKTWVSKYCSFYYGKDDSLVQNDTELQSWWKEIRTKGHGDKKDEPWWPKMQTIAELIESCTIIIWIASAFHAAINFGQYAYAGYLPNRPTISRRFMPESGTPEYAELESNPESAYLKTVIAPSTAYLQTLLGASIMGILSRHSKDEVYLGQRDDGSEWTSDEEPLKAFKEFHDELVKIEKNITERNDNPELKNRLGLVKVPYTVLYPNTSDTSKTGGLTGKGVPNSISI